MNAQLEIPVELKRLAEKFGLDPEFLARRILSAWTERHKNAARIIIEPSKGKEAA